jgi:DNA-binding transcriptional LysR family regulator
MDLFRSMQAFVATVQSGSMSAAANALGLSSAMVGQHIAALEKRLDTRLLNRTTRSQSLTDFGAGYFEQCRDILERVAATEEDAQALQAKPRGLLRITAPLTFGTELLAPALGIYRQFAPDVTLDIRLTDRNVDLVEEGIDIAFRIGKLADSRVIARPLAPYRMMVCAAPDYLARRGTPRHPSELAAHDAIGFTQTRGPWKFDRDGEWLEVTPSPVLTINSGQAMRRAACAGLGVIMQPAMMLERDVEAGALVKLFPEWRLPERPMSLLYYRDRQMTPRLRSFIAFATEAFSDCANADEP